MEADYLVIHLGFQRRTQIPFSVAFGSTRAPKTNYLTTITAG
jgi:hypothetical protein